MKLVLAEDRIKFLEEEITHTSSWLAKRNGISQDKLKEFVSLMSENIKELFSLKGKVEKTKIEKFFDENRTIKQAELFRDELDLRAKINQNIASFALLDGGSKVDVDNYYFQSKEMRKLSSEISQKLNLLKYTEDLVG